MGMAAIAEQLEAAQERLGALRAERVQTMMRGEAFDSSPIGELEQRIAGLREAEREAERQERAAQRLAAEERDRETVEAVARDEERRLKLAAEAERLCAEFGRTLAELIRDSQDMESRSLALIAARGTSAHPQSSS